MLKDLKYPKQLINDFVLQYDTIIYIVRSGAPLRAGAFVYKQGEGVICLIVLMDIPCGWEHSSAQHFSLHWALSL